MSLFHGVCPWCVPGNNQVEVVILVLTSLSVSAPGENLVSKDVNFISNGCIDLVVADICQSRSFQLQKRIILYLYVSKEFVVTCNCFGEGCKSNIIVGITVVDDKRSFVISYGSSDGGR